jgi:O-antigen/teichoic acid export membrane protein
LDIAVVSTNQLDRSLVTGIGWTAAFRWASQVISWGGTLYAARILAPADYGVIAMAMVPVGLLRMIEDFGFDTVLLQNRDLSDDQVARLGGLALLFGALLTACLALLGPVFAAFYGEPVVADVVAALSLLVLLDALQVVPRVRLQRDLDFFWLGAVYLMQTVAVTGTLIFLASGGAGLWALVINTIAGSAVATVALFVLRPFIPLWPGRLAGLRGPLLSGWRMLVSRAAYYANSNADQLLAGRVLGKEALGHYSFAMSIASLPVQEITSLVSRVVPGIFSAAQDDRKLLLRYFLALTEAISYLAFPVSCGLALTASHVIAVALGPQWSDAVVPLQALSIYMALFAAQTLVSHVLLWTGHFRQVMWFSLLSLVVLPVGFLIGMRFGGLAGLAYAWSIAYPLSCLPAILYAKRLIKLRWADYLNALLPAATGCLVMAGAVIAVDALVSSGQGDIVALATEAAVGAAVYVTVMVVGFRRRLMAFVVLVRSVRSPALGIS